MADKPEAGVNVRVDGDVSGKLIVAGRDVNVTRYSHADRLHQRSRAVLLDKVEQFWVEGVLDKSLHGAALLDLGMKPDPASVEHPWEILYESLQDDQPARELKSKRIGAAFEGAGGALLILGAPGSGKTTTLLQLARELIAQARADPAYPVPVVVNLSSWKSRQTIEKWLAVELNEKYGVPRAVGETWIRQQQILPLLDGLDEVAAERRDACVEAINAYRVGHGLAGIAVCSRLADYQALKGKLRLEGAIIVQPLTFGQIDDYLARAGDDLAAVRDLVERDPVIREMVETPLLLSIMTLAYRNTPAERLPTQGSFGDRVGRLFDTYVARMFKRRLHAPPFPEDKMRRWLSGLASTMQSQSQTEFIIERMQPSVLGRGPWRWLYSLGVLLGALLTMAVFSFLFDVISRIIRDPAFSPQSIAANWPSIAFMALLLALIAWVLNSFGAHIRLAERLGWSLNAFRRGIVKRALRGVLVAIGVVMLYNVAAYWAIGYYSFDWLDLTFVKGLLVLGALGAVPAVLFGGLVNPQLASTTSAFEGLRRSLLNGLIIAPVMAALISVVYIIYVSPVDRNLSLLSVVLGGAFIIAWLQMGGLAPIEHMVLRAILFLTGRQPWRMLPFLDYAADLILMRKVGGGYIFVHRLLMEHFAAMEH